MTRKRKPIHSIVLYLLLIGFSAVFMVPMIWMLSTSAKSLKQVYSTKPQFFDWPIYIRENYNYVIQSYHFFSYFGNTLKVAVIATFGRVLSSAMAGYAFARIDFPGRKVLFAIALCTMMIPSQVTQIPTYIVYSRIHWLDSYLPMTVPSYFGNVFSIFLMRQFFFVCSAGNRRCGKNRWLRFLANFYKNNDSARQSRYNHDYAVCVS